MLHETFLNLIFFSTFQTISTGNIYTHTTHKIMSMQETMEHRIIRSKNWFNASIKIEKREDDDIDVGDLSASQRSPLRSPKRIKSSLSPIPTASTPLKSPTATFAQQGQLLPEFSHIPRVLRRLTCQATALPSFLYGVGPKTHCNGRRM